MSHRAGHDDATRVMLCIMGAIKDLWQSERGLVAIALIIAGTVLRVTGGITADQWLSYTQWVFGIYVAGKTITGTTAMLTSTPTSQPAPHVTSDHVDPPASPGTPAAPSSPVPPAVPKES